MRIDSLEIENFKGFARQTFALHPQFTLFVGENGSGKTSVLDALAVAAGVWLVEVPDSTLRNSGRNIAPTEIRLEGIETGDRVQFRERKPVIVRATGQIGSRNRITWARQIRATGSRTSNADAQEALAYVKDIYARDAAGENVLCPVLAYYGAGRAWLPSYQTIAKSKASGPARKWGAYYDCFNERIRFAELRRWFSRETTERGNRGGQWRPGFEAVRHAILRCVPGASDVWFDVDRDAIVLSIDGCAQPFDNLSAGQRMMLALVADLAIKAVTLNPFLVSAGSEEALRQTPGLVLIDELDVHLHPKWQRRVASDLKATFPSIQFACTTHSPQVIGEVSAQEIRILSDAAVSVPGSAYGMDSNRVLEELMGAAARNPDRQARLDRLFSEIDRENFAEARRLLGALEEAEGASDPELIRARTLMKFLEPA